MLSIPSLCFYVNVDTMLLYYKNITANSSTAPPTGEKLSLNTVMGVLFMVFYISVFMASMVGNSLVLLVCYRSLKKQRHEETSREHFFNLYIANLAISDLLFTILTIFDALYAINNEWTSGNFTCRTQGFLVENCYTASILTLVAISRERVTTVTRVELNDRQYMTKQRKIAVTIIWICAFFVCSPLLYAYSTYFDTREMTYKCHNLYWGETARRVYYSIVVIPLFFIPLSFMIFTHVRIHKVLKSQVAPSEHMQKVLQRRRKKASRMLGMVTLMFFILWSPFIIFRSLRYFNWYTNLEPWKLSQLLTIASSASNPFIYCFYSTQFRNYLKTVIACRCTKFITGFNGDGTTTLDNSIN